MTWMLEQQIAALDPELFDFLDVRTPRADRQALLAIHSATADVCGSFGYLEIGSHLGGSLQVVMRDPRCRQTVSIDVRTTEAPDVRRGSWMYEDNSTQHMLQLLRELPDVDITKLTTFEASTEDLRPSEVNAVPDFCFIDGEHTPMAVLRDANFCAEVMRGTGVIAFHDYTLVGSGIAAFLRDNWRQISYAVSFSGPGDPSAGGGVFALELGDRGVLRRPVVDRAVGSRWHEVIWRLTNRSRHTPLPFLIAWALMPGVDSFVVHARHGMTEYVRRSRS